jgi:zinc transporter ZupT
MFSAILMITGGLAGIAVGLPLAHRWPGMRGILAATVVLAGTTIFLGGVIIAVVPNFFYR